MYPEAITLFDLPPADATQLRLASEYGYDLRDSQIEDVDAAMQAIREGNRTVLYVAATGYGKSVCLSELARRLAKDYRVLTTVDVGSLARDLAGSISHHTGEPCGILTGEEKENLGARIIASTIQTLYAKCPHTKRKRYEWAFDPKQPWALLVDECESAIAKEFLGVCRYFLDGNPNNVLIGTTATPMRGDKRGLSELFQYARNEPGPLNRNIKWCCDNGWLIRPRQAFVRVSLDFSTLKVSKNTSGEIDYKDEELGKMLEDEKALREFAVGIHKIANGSPSIVIVPTIDVAEKLSHHLCAVAGDRASHAVSSRHKSLAKENIERFKRGEYPYIVSVSMLYKGFDADLIRFVFMGRKTQSQRIYAQALGRGTRPLKAIRDALAAAPDAAARLEIIAASDKPFMTMVDLVGIKPSVKDVSVVDVLGESQPEEVRERAKKKMLEADEDETPQDAENAVREAVDELAEQERKRQARERRKRELIQVDGHVDIEYTDGGKSAARVNPTSLPDRLRANLMKFGVSDREIASWNEATAKAANARIMHHVKNNLVTWKQAKALKRFGYTKEQLAVMPKAEASTILDAKFGGRNAVAGA